VSGLSFSLEDEEQLVSYKYIRNFLGFKKDIPERVDVQENVLQGFWGDDYKKPKFLLVGISLGIEYMHQGEYISGDERRG
jgi:hypothetical protein